jgi:spermidine synthase
MTYDPFSINPMSPRRFLPALVLLFLGSGCAALIYEIVWFQLLQLVIGSSSISLGILLGTFMGGMCLGSLLLPRLVSRGQHPLRVYAAMELGIGLLGLLILTAMPLVGGAYTAWAGTGMTGIFVRAIVAGICLLPPTVLMGATLPAIARWVKTTPEGVAWLGFFYGGNIAGGVLGCLLAGFYLLRIYDVTVATLVAVAINATVALIALLLSRQSTHFAESAPERPLVNPATRPVYATIALSGLTALGAEVIWTRLLSLHFGGTVYAFALILAVFLLGLGIGSTVGAAVARRAASPQRLLGWCQLLLCAAIAWAAYNLSRTSTYWAIDPSVLASPWITFQLDFARCLGVVLPGALLWGASFPLALAAVAAHENKSTEQDTGRLASGVYAANTVGAIAGSLVISFAVIPWIGTSHSEQVLIVLSLLSGFLVLEPTLVSETGGSLRWNRAGTVTLILAIVYAGLLARSVPRLPGALVAYGRFAATRADWSTVIYVGEGVNATVAVSETDYGVRNYHNAGKIQASSEPQDMRLQRMLGHMTTLIPAHPRKVLVIGCGAGVTAGAVSVDPAVEQETIVEIEPLVPRVVSTYFSEYNFDVVRNPKVNVRIDDARHFVETTNEKFDAITSDPLDPWVKGAAMLYTQEFFEMAKRRLNPGGVVTLFVQLYESNTEAVKSEIATFLNVFPHGTVWSNTNEGQGYDLVLMAQMDPQTINVDAIQAKLDSPEYAEVANSLREIGMNSAVDLFSTYAGRKSDLAPWLKDASLNRDRNLRLQYLAGLGLNEYKADEIYQDMLRFVHTTPQDLFAGSEQTRYLLFSKIRNAQGW